MATKKPTPIVKYPRVICSAATHARVQKAAKKLGKDMSKIGDNIVRAGLKALGY